MSGWTRSQAWRAPRGRGPTGLAADQPGQLGHHRLDAGRVALGVGRQQEHPVEPLVVGAGPQGPAGRPTGLPGRRVARGGGRPSAGRRRPPLLRSRRRSPPAPPSRGFADPRRVGRGRGRAPLSMRRPARRRPGGRSAPSRCRPSAPARGVRGSGGGGRARRPTGRATAGPPKPSSAGSGGPGGARATGRWPRPRCWPPGGAWPGRRRDRASRPARRAGRPRGPRPVRALPPRPRVRAMVGGSRGAPERTVGSGGRVRPACARPPPRRPGRERRRGDVGSVPPGSAGCRGDAVRRPGHGRGPTSPDRLPATWPGPGLGRRAAPKQLSDCLTFCGDPHKVQ